VINVFPIIMLGISGYNYVIIAFLFLIIAFGVYLFWHTITRFQVEMEGMIRKIMLPNTKNTENQDSNRRMMMSIFEGIMKNKIMDQIEINEKSPVIGKSIADTKLRTRTGTTIIGIERANEMINNPRPKTLLLLGDKVTLVGDPEERDGAKKILIGQ
jgi:DNA/RNA endonuclease YhcR with UshA esterase domain